MDATGPCIPPGFRFHPTDEELVGYYLRKKVASQKIELDVIRDIDLYRIEPWDLQDRCGMGYEEQNEWYFFSHKDKKYPTGTRTNRATMAGFWKATGRDKAVHEKSRLIGMRKTLVFYKGRAPNGQKTDWIMHEYRLESEDSASSLPQEEGWVVCRAFKKRTNCQPRNVVETWRSMYCYEEPNKVSTNIDPIEYVHKHSKRLMCNQESELDPLNLLQMDQFVQLPQLDNPSLLQMKHQTLLPMASKNEDEYQLMSCNSIARVTDWRDLDKFVASQLSQEDVFEAKLGSDFVVDCDSEMALMLLQNEREEGGKLNAFLNTRS